MIVDAQLHLWGEPSAGRPWPPGTAGSAHRARPYDAAELLAAMDGAGVDRAVLVPPSWEGDRNDLALAAAQRYPDRFAVMGRLDVTDPDRALAAVADWKAQPGMTGLRLTFHRPPHRELFASGALDALWPALEAADIPVALYPPGQLPQVGVVAARHPGLRLAVDHLALPTDVTGPAAFAELDDLLALAVHPRVAVKASCLPASSAEPYPFRDLDDPLRRVVDAFGPDRVFWGSDLTRLPCTYRECLDHVAGLPFLDEKDAERILGTALSDWLGWPE
ncbi:amidohydrolase family protein [Actinacidiphila acididurans]|uniref:Amidohydrolase family protein n=1 Tax=Actinacidiphila acididurans TaxID=2784346 RepID=A0ABS2TVE7_9ACTN|nr:amidohydrolase family protein [Actinacidiphila acididurans]MBM9507309.1 amidohydrolase family protein [Actinacidiphila acididurans]